MVAGRWIDVGEEASLKKRRVSSGEVVDEKEKVTMTKEKKGNMRKRRMSKQNFNGYEDSGEKEEIDEEKDGSDYSTELVKKRGNGSSSNSSSSGGGGGSSSVIEGSRCSRVNGRGWRCCQQTLVGYALCEHHLGKGRLRSMVSVRSRSSPPAVAVVAAAPRGDDEGSLPCLPCKQQEEDGDDEELGEKLMIMKEKKRKRKRIGTVKARSISSLLGQTHHAAAAAEAAAAATTAIGLGSNHSSSNDNIVA